VVVPFVRFGIPAEWADAFSPFPGEMCRQLSFVYLPFREDALFPKKILLPPTRPSVHPPPPHFIAVLTDKFQKSVNLGEGENECTCTRMICVRIHVKRFNGIPAAQVGRFPFALHSAVKVR
jgi:hypothetical protein